ncbi:MAG: helix-turn-helix domain-containing protein, partial [Myxococcota bacterium]
MTDDQRRLEALFRYAVLGEILHRPLRRGDLRRGLRVLAGRIFTGPDGRQRRYAEKTLQEWYYQFRRGGFDALVSRPRSDRGKCRALDAEQQKLILAMKREDPGRSAQLIFEELRRAGLVRRDGVSVSTICRLLRREGLTGPRKELERPARFRWQASTCGELWQGDALHGPKLFDPSSGKEVRVKVFGLIDDRSRLVPYLRADFHETQQAFLTVLLGAVLRRGRPHALLLDNHGSFTGSDVEIACARLDTRLIFARPFDGAGKGKIERFWRTLRARLLDRLDLEKIQCLDDLNLRLSTWVEGEYNTRAHSSLSGKSPLQVFEEDHEEIRWIEDAASVESAFTHSITRSVRLDSTCQIYGRIYEVPPALRGRSAEIHY